MRRTLWILSLACIFSATGYAQQRGGGAMPMMSGAHFSAAPAPMAASRAGTTRPASTARPAARAMRTSTRTTASPKPVHPISWNGVSRSNNTPANPIYPYGNPVVNGYPAPGLGFDYAHYFAVHPNAGRCYRCSGYGFGNGYVVPFVDGGLYLPYPGGYADQSAEAQPPEEGAPAEQAAQAEQPGPPENYYNYNPPVRPASQSAPRPQAEYVFVRRDGTLIFAVAYSWINDRLQYVSEEGLRRTVPVDTLDLNATQQFNDQRGVPIRFPA